MSKKRTQTKGERRLNLFLSVISWTFILIGVGVLLWFYFFSRSHVTTNDAQVRQYITPVSSKVSGYIEAVLFEENQYVHKGDTLVVIDNREYRHEVEIARANLESTAQSVAIYQKAVDSKASVTEVVDANIDAVKADIWKLEHDYKRFKNLVEEDAATMEQFEQVDTKLRQARAKLVSLQKERRSILISAQAEETKVAPAKTLIGQRKAQLQNAELLVEYSYVVAPYDGWVGTKNIQPGQMVKEGQALVQVVSEEKWIVANYKETQIGEMDLKKEIKIVADAYPDIEFIGVVESFSPASGSEFALIKPDNATGNFVKIEQRFPVKIILKSEKHTELLRSGMNVIVTAEKAK